MSAGFADVFVLHVICDSIFYGQGEKCKIFEDCVKILFNLVRPVNGDFDNP